MKLVTIDPRRIELADYGVLHLQPAPGHQRRGHARARARRRTATGSSTARSSPPAPRASTSSTSCSPTTRPTTVEAITGVPAADLERAAHIYAEAAQRLHPLGPRRHRAQVRLRGRAADLQPRDDDRQGRPPRLGAAAAARPEQRPGLVRHGRAARHLHGVPLGRRRGRRALASRSAGASPISREKGYKIPQMFDAAVAGDLKAMYIFGEDVAQTDPDTAPRRRRRSRTLEFLVCQDIFETETTKFADVDPARLGVPREGRHVHQRRAALPARRAGDRRRPATRGPTSRSSRPSRAALGPRDGLRDALGRRCDESRADARLRRRHLRAARPQRACSGRSRPTAPTRRSSTSDEFDAPRRHGAVRRAAVQGAGRPTPTRSSR